MAKSHKKIQVRIVGNNDMSPEECKENMRVFLDWIFTKKSISEAKQKESSENHNDDSVVSGDKLLNNQSKQI